MKIENLEQKLNISKDELFQNLSQREKQILELRYSLKGQKSTLQDIGKGLMLSRERIRQIENRAKSKLASQLSKTNRNYFGDIAGLILENGGLISEKIVSQSVNQKNELNLYLLILDLNPKLIRLKDEVWPIKVWRCQSLSKSKIESLAKIIEAKLKEAQKPLVISEFIKELAVTKDFDRLLFEAIIESNRNFISKGSKLGLFSDRTINPRTVADKILFIMEEAGSPLHFAEITERIEDYGFDNKTVNKSTVHNELIANSKYILVGRGMYALKKWGYRSGSVGEIIEGFLAKRSEPQSLTAIIDYVLSERTIKKNTVLVNLAKNRKISKTKSGEYCLRQV